MRNFVPCLRSSLLARVALVALAAGSVAACSSDSTRFGGDPNANPYQESSSRRSAEPDTTGGITPAPTTRVERSSLGAPSAAQSRPMKGFEGSGGSYRSSSLEPRATGSLAPARAAISRPAPITSSATWTADNGTTVTLQRGESIHTLSQRYGVPASAIMSANGMSNANGVGEGSRVVIPTYAGGRAVASTPAVARPAPIVTTRPAPMRTEIAAAPTAPRTKMTFVEGARPAGAAAKATTKPAEPKQLAEVKPVAPAKSAPALKPSVESSERAFAAKPARPEPATETNDNVKTAALKVDPAPAAEPSGPSFRWPARGRVISGYGSKTSGASNDGVNIAVPEGTDVKASDDGVVAYSGSELKGFGNLVLIRHSNGWVTAYAHNSANAVKRGDTVRRGQIIAKSGATGNVSTPQLHFEVRKGASTVDPLKHLPDV